MPNDCITSKYVSRSVSVEGELTIQVGLLHMSY